MKLHTYLRAALNFITALHFGYAPHEVASFIPGLKRPETPAVHNPHTSEGECIEQVLHTRNAPLANRGIRAALEGHVRAIVPATGSFT